MRRRWRREGAGVKEALNSRSREFTMVCKDLPSRLMSGRLNGLACSCFLRCARNAPGFRKFRIRGDNYIRPSKSGHLIRITCVFSEDRRAGSPSYGNVFTMIEKSSYVSHQLLPINCCPLALSRGVTFAERVTTDMSELCRLRQSSRSVRYHRRSQHSGYHLLMSEGLMVKASCSRRRLGCQIASEARVIPQ